mmetsp:Transcript_83509/g.221556  ORF Transcript_83509/g.221556 Transcript_83509/m.221556 type:complete len:426 (-) Transcript_83509:1966-3243(-)
MPDVHAGGAKVDLGELLHHPVLVLYAEGRQVARSEAEERNLGLPWLQNLGLAEAAHDLAGRLGVGLLKLHVRLGHLPAGAAARVLHLHAHADLCGAGLLDDAGHAVLEGRVREPVPEREGDVQVGVPVGGEHPLGVLEVPRLLVLDGVLERLRELQRQPALRRVVAEEQRAPGGARLLPSQEEVGHRLDLVHPGHHHRTGRLHEHDHGLLVPDERLDHGVDVAGQGQPGVKDVPVDKLRCGGRAHHHDDVGLHGSVHGCLYAEEVGRRHDGDALHLRAPPDALQRRDRLAGNHGARAPAAVRHAVHHVLVVDAALGVAGRPDDGDPRRGLPREGQDAALVLQQDDGRLCRLGGQDRVLLGVLVGCALRDAVGRHAPGDRVQLHPVDGGQDAPRCLVDRRRPQRAELRVREEVVVARHVLVQSVLD